MGAVLNDEELAQLLKLDEGLIDRLLAETDLPRVAIAGHVRFITDDVLSWLRTQQSVLPVTESVPITVAPAPPEPQPIPTLRSAEQDEVPFVSRGALSSLGTGRSDPSENLARQQVRDALAAMGDALHTRLVRLSHDRLHPSSAESDRTSPWRLGDGISTIDHITMTWTDGQGAPGLKDRAHLALSVTAKALALVVRGPSGTPAPAPQGQASTGSGGQWVNEGEGHGWTVGRRYAIADGPAPTAATLLAHLEVDADALVPMWLEAAAGGEGR